MSTQERAPLFRLAESDQRSHELLPTRVIAGFLAALWGVEFLAVGWGGWYITDHVWPGFARLVIASVVGYSVATWGVLQVRGRLPLHAGRVRIRGQQAGVVLIGILGGTALMMAFYNW